MTFWGMDLAQVRGHADGLGRQAEELQALVQQVDALVDQAGWAWPGPDADAFRDAWFSSYRSSMGAAATQLGDAVAVLYRQIEEQAAASGEDFPGGAYAISGAGDGDSWFDNVAGALPWANALWGSAGLLTTLGANSSLTGRYTKLYGGLTKLMQGVLGGHVTDDFFHYKRSLNGLFSVDGPAARLAKNPAFGFLNTVTGIYSFGESSWSAVDPSASIHDRIYGTVDTVGDGLKLSKNPVSYLSGVIVSTGGLIGQEAEKIDWSPEGTSMTWNYIKDHPGEMATEFVRSIPNVLGGVL